LKDVTHEEREGPGYTMLGRGEPGAAELLALFAQLNPGIREQGWTLCEIGQETLLDLLDEFEYVALDHDPRPGPARSRALQRASPARSGSAAYEAASPQRCGRRRFEQGGNGGNHWGIPLRAGLFAVQQDAALRSGQRARHE
jgi:hypothetical protein